MEDALIFKSYLRMLLRDLNDIKGSLKEKNFEKAEKLLDDLIEDTKEGTAD